MIVYFIFYLVFYSPFVFGLSPQGSYFGVQYEVYGGGSFWLCVLLTPAVAILPVFAYRSFNIELRPTLSDYVRRQRKSGNFGKPVKFLGMRPRTTSTRSSNRLGYAFAQEDNLWARINSGRLARSSRKSKDKDKREKGKFF